MKVVVTGASRGLGKSIAGIYAEHGHQLFLSARNEAALSETAKGIEGRYSGSKIKAHAFDLGIREQVEALARWCLEDGVPDILVNNAGIFEPGSVYNEPEGSLEHMLNVNLLSAYHLTRALLPGMIQRKSGHIFNICSIASLKAYPNGGAYSISKFALYGFSKNLREELKSLNIKVTAVLPGAAYTDSWKSSGVLKERIMEPEDIARMVFTSSQLSPQACVEDIIVRPQLGDL